MYLNALEFLEEERDAWRPYEALADVPDERMSMPVDGAHGWTARDLIAHLIAWQEWALATARDLAVGEHSPTKDRLDAEWERRGDDMNADILAEWQALPLAEVRRRLHETPGELRGYLTVVPETRWLKNSEQQRFFYEETIEHYEDHKADLAAILAAAGRA